MKGTLMYEGYFNVWRECLNQPCQVLLNLKSSPRIDDFKYLLFYWYLICSPQGRFSSNYLSKIYLQTLSSYLLSRTHSCALAYALPIFLFIVKPLYVIFYNESFPLNKNLNHQISQVNKLTKYDINQTINKSYYQQFNKQMEYLIEQQENHNESINYNW